LQLLYQLDIGSGDLHQMIESFWSQIEGPVEQNLRDFSANLVEGVWQRKDELDEMIASYSTNWRVSRMAAVDKNILRMAIFELIHCPDIPVKVTLNEAVEIAKRFGTAESGSFVNGILDNIAKDKVKDEQES
jgi:N utilization substance protein B